MGYVGVCAGGDVEALFGTLDGAYQRLVMVRDVGIPTVHISLDYKAPLRYGDVAIVDVDVLKVGKYQHHLSAHDQAEGG